MIPLVLLAIVILLAPGAAAARALGVRGPLGAALWAPFSVGLIALSSILLGWTRIPWNLLSASITMAVLVAVVAAARWLAGRVRPMPVLRPTGLRWDALLVGLLLAGVGLTSTMVFAFPSPDLFLQTFDNVFHLNAVRYILDTANASPFWVMTLTTGGQPPTFYPTGWHSYVSLIMGTAAVVDPTMSIAIAANAALLAVIVLGWSLGVLVMAQLVAGPSISVSMLTAAVIWSVYLFPWRLLPWGTLYPNILGFALMPGAMAPLLVLAGFHFPDRGGSRPPRAGPTLRWGPLMPSLAAPRRPHQVPGADVPNALAVIAAALAVPGVMLAHPNAGFSLLYLIVVIAWSMLVKAWLARPSGRSALGRAVAATVAVLALTVGFCYGWVRFAPGTPATPFVLTNTWTEIVNLLIGAPAKTWTTPIIAGLIVFGLVVAAVTRRITLLAFALPPAGLYVLLAGGGDPGLMLLLGGMFYEDMQRAAVFAYIAALPLLLLGLGTIVRILDRGIQALLGGTWLRAVATGVLSVAIAAALAVPTWVNGLAPQLAVVSGIYIVPSPVSRYVSADEFALMERMRSRVPVGYKVIGDPGNGSSFIYAVSGVPVVFPHLLITDTPAMTVIRNSLFVKTKRAEVCQAIKELNAYYFADFGKGRYSYGGIRYYPGLRPVRTWMLKLVDQQGDARLYKITICDQQDRK